MPRASARGSSVLVEGVRQRDLAGHDQREVCPVDEEQVVPCAPSRAREVVDDLGVEAAHRQEHAAGAVELAVDLGLERREVTSGRCRRPPPCPHQVGERLVLDGTVDLFVGRPVRRAVRQLADREQVREEPLKRVAAGLHGHRARGERREASRKRGEGPATGLFFGDAGGLRRAAGADGVGVRVEELTPGLADRSQRGERGRAGLLVRRGGVGAAHVREVPHDAPDDGLPGPPAAGQVVEDVPGYGVLARALAGVPVEQGGRHASPDEHGPELALVVERLAADGDG